MSNPERDADRRADLESYLLKCVRDNVFSWSDLIGIDVIDRLVSAISGDVRTVLPKMARTGGSNFLKKVADLASRAADTLTDRKGRRR